MPVKQSHKLLLHIHKEIISQHIVPLRLPRVAANFDLFDGIYTRGLNLSHFTAVQTLHLSLKFKNQLKTQLDFLN